MPETPRWGGILVRCLPALTGSFLCEGAAALLSPPSEWPSFSPRLDPQTLQSKLISTTHICTLILLVITQSAWPLVRAGMTGKRGSFPSHYTSIASSSLETPICLLSPRSWTRPQDTWTHPLGEATRHPIKMDIPHVSSWEPCPEIWRW